MDQKNTNKSEWLEYVKITPRNTLLHSWYKELLLLRIKKIVVLVCSVIFKLFFLSLNENRALQGEASCSIIHALSQFGTQTLTCNGKELLSLEEDPLSGLFGAY